jgi:hypothetical protein
MAAPQLPAEMQYKPDEDVAKAYQQVDRLVALIQAKAKTHITGKKLAEECLLPMVGVFAGLIQKVHGDVVTYSMAVASVAAGAAEAADNVEPELVVGIPADDVAALVNALNDVAQILATYDLLADSERKPKMDEAIATLNNVAETIASFEMEDDEDDEYEDADDLELSPLIAEE